MVTWVWGGGEIGESPPPLVLNYSKDTLEGGGGMAPPRPHPLTTPLVPSTGRCPRCTGIHRDKHSSTASIHVHTVTANRGHVPWDMSMDSQPPHSH